MKKFLNMLVAAMIVTIIISSISSPAVFASYIEVVVQTEVDTTVMNQPIPPTTEGDSPPIDENTNLPIAMTAAPIEIINEYVVQEGDSLSEIADNFVLDVETLIKWNNLISDTILIGQTLSVNGQVEPTAEQIAAIEAEQRSRMQAQQNENNAQGSIQAANTPAESTPSAPTADANNLIAIAQQYLGSPYIYGGTTPNGFDCSGYVSYVFMQAGKLSSNHSTVSLYNIAQKVSQPQVGDLVFFSGTYRAGISHVGIYMGNNLMINASGNKVQINNIYDSYWGKHFTGFGRI